MKDPKAKALFEDIARLDRMFGRDRSKWSLDLAARLQSAIDGVDQVWALAQEIESLGHQPPWWKVWKTPSRWRVEFTSRSAYTILPEKEPMKIETLFVVERHDGGDGPQSYWTGVDEAFSENVDEALRFITKRDALNVMHWKLTDAGKAHARVTPVPASAFLS